MRIEEVDLSEIAHAILASHAQESRGELSSRIQPGLIARADRALISMVLENLIANSIKFARTGRRTQIQIGQTDSPKGRCFYVRDNGIGFDMAYTLKIFVPFERLHREDDYPGTGIGLANAKRIIERHGGDIWAEAEPGVGATFYFTLEPIETLGGRG